MKSGFRVQNVFHNNLLAAVSALLAVLAVSPRDANAIVEPPDAAEVLFVVSGYYPQEDAIKDHLNELEIYNITEAADYQIRRGTDLSGFDLIIITGFAPNISNRGLANISSSGKPVLIVEYWGFEYSYRLGLTPYFIDPVQYSDKVETFDYVANTYTRFLGNPVQVYNSPYVIEAVPEWNLAQDVVALFKGAGDFYDADYPVITHPGRKIIATGIYETTLYTDLGWRMFDIMLGSLHQVGPNYANTNEAVEGYVVSGLADYIDKLSGREPTEEVVKFAWERMSTWNLFVLEGFITQQLYEINPQFDFIPVPYSWWTYIHDEYGSGDDSLWFLGEDSSYDTPVWDYYIEGTDLGISVNLFDKTFFYMGDTWPGSNASTLNCDPDAVCDDAIVGLSPIEFYPENGIDAYPYTDSSFKYIPQSIPGVHTEVFDPDYWIGSADPEYTVPTGAVTTGVIRSTTIGGFTHYFSVPTIMLWYATGSSPNTVNHGYPKLTPRSWIGCSTNGLDFDNCYDPIVPFSEDKSGEPARFIQVAPVPVSFMDLRNMCNAADGYDQDNPLCEPEIYDDDFTVGGVLLYGNGRHYRLSGLYVAYIRNDEIGEIDSLNKPIAHYLAKDQGLWVWSDNEADAARILPETSPALDSCDGLLSRSICKTGLIAAAVLNPSLKDSVFGEFSVKIVRDGIADGDPPALVMLSSGHELITDPSDNVRFRATRLDTFWDWGAAQMTGGQGYGSYIVEKFTDYDSSADSLTLWFLTSKWGYGPYGVYSDNVTISPWPI
ncbi:MAG: hypothetical protein GY854_28650 [Deltaproteobacteria bacterium]|nr:hypothetical protein [Deltaproteobacteria bacterium]